MMFDQSNHFNDDSVQSVMLDQGATSGFKKNYSYAEVLKVAVL